MYCAKNRSRTCGFFLPDGFPVDPVHVTALFVAARVDELIMWDWNIVLWCPYLFWALAVCNCFVYGIVAFDVVRTHAAQCGPYRNSLRDARPQHVRETMLASSAVCAPLRRGPDIKRTSL